MTELTDLVLLPGLLDDGAMFADQIEGLKDVAKALALDLVGQETVSDSARWVLQQAPERFALAGFSMGGYVAFEILRQAPERISKLALLNTSARADTEERIAQREAMIARAEGGGYETLVDELIPQVVHPSRIDDRKLTGEIRAMALRIGAQAFVRQLKVIMSRPDSRADLPSIACPTLIMVGREDVLTPLELSEEMADVIPHSTLAVVETCNHYSPMEQPEAVTQHLRTWLLGAGSK